MVAAGEGGQIEAVLQHDVSGSQRPGRQRTSALQDGPGEIGPGFRGQEVKARAGRAGIRPEKSDVTPAASAEAAYVVVDPSQCQSLVQQPQVALGIEPSPAGVEEASDSEAVVDADDDNVMLGCEVGAVRQRGGAGAGNEAAAVEPDEGGERVVGVLVLVLPRNPHVEVQAVLPYPRRRGQQELFAVGSTQPQGPVTP